MDAVGFRKAALIGGSDGGSAAMMFAATRPERTRALILAGAVPYWGFAGWHDMDPAEVRARLVRELGVELHHETYRTGMAPEATRIP